jgi:hypothetical protein
VIPGLYTFVEESRRWTFQSVLHNVFVSQNVASQKTSWGGETSDKHLTQGRDCIEDARKFPAWTVSTLTSFLVMPINHAFLEELAPFPYSPFVGCTFTLHFNIMPVNFHRMNIFSISNAYHHPHFTGRGFSIFVLIFNNYSKGGKIFDTVLQI